MFDANPFGVIAALGVPAVAACAFLTAWFGRGVVVAVIVAMAWLALWASGSRTALAAGLIGTAFVLYDCGNFVLRDRRLRRRWAFAPIVLVLVLIVAPIVLQRVSPVGPWRRLEASLPTLTDSSSLPRE